MKRITGVSPLSGYRLSVEFEDGVAGTIELESELFGEAFEPLHDPALFAQVRLDEFGVPCWPTGADLAPDAIYAQLTGQPISRIATSLKSSEPQKPI